jgi:hypothetical protein
MDKPRGNSAKDVDNKQNQKEDKRNSNNNNNNNKHWRNGECFLQVFPLNSLQKQSKVRRGESSSSTWGGGGGSEEQRNMRNEVVPRSWGKLMLLQKCRAFLSF